MSILVTGAAGFIGSEFVKQLLNIYDEKILVIDLISYAGSLNNLNGILEHVEFHKIDIRDKEKLGIVFSNNSIESVINFAAETHVDNSINEPSIFFTTNILGTSNLLELSVKNKVNLFFQISTDEVYGSISHGFASESDVLNPSSPYAASKASAEMLVNSYKHTYDLKTVIARCSNNYGPRQFPEKFIPVAIKNLLECKKVRIYGDGLNIREWIFVEDTCKALIKILFDGVYGEIYNVSSSDFKNNLEVFRELCRLLQSDHSNFEFVSDRAGHDFRYALNSSKIKNDLDWEPKISFNQGLQQTVEWYLNNKKRFLKW